MGKILFKETQKYAVLMVAAMLSTIFFGVFCVIQIVLGKPVGNHPAPDALLIVFFVVSVATIFLAWYQKLVFIITEDELHISFGILTSSKTIKMSDVKNISTRKYNAMKEFWGWGVRFRKNITCFTVSGSDAVEIELKSGEKLLVGTQKMTEVAAVVLKL
ncbi:hypothetical protein HDF18_18910 [Mucilaginibacter sp. X5P1]|uniref:hypothetical protein n=1 Tax=Mucilaginibacter sp. X5P1 TaxID=2723088 RepID=UPI00162216A0|nr:hypothetical protein [Mucilaginibacter sp. X5P1]MBB6139718.1 hypothetical protein [Mucilaginibacter sp. X5P1]